MKATLLLTSSRKEVATGKFSFLFLQLGANYQKASVPQCIKGKAQFLDKYKDKQHKARWRSKKSILQTRQIQRYIIKFKARWRTIKNPFCKPAVAELTSQQPTSLGHSCFYFFYLISYILHFFYCSALKITKFKEKLKYPNCSGYCSGKKILKSI